LVDSELSARRGETETPRGQSVPEVERSPSDFGAGGAQGRGRKPGTGARSASHRRVPSVIATDPRE